MRDFFNTFKKNLNYAFFQTLVIKKYCLIKYDEKMFQFFLVPFIIKIKKEILQINITNHFRNLLLNFKILY